MLVPERPEEYVSDPPEEEVIWRFTWETGLGAGAFGASSVCWPFVQPCGHLNAAAYGTLACSATYPNLHELVEIQDRLVGIRATRPRLETFVEDGCARVISTALRAIACWIEVLIAAFVRTATHRRYMPVYAYAR